MAVSINWGPSRWVPLQQDSYYLGSALGSLIFGNYHLDEIYVAFHGFTGGLHGSINIYG